MESSDYISEFIIDWQFLSKVIWGISKNKDIYLKPIKNFDEAKYRIKTSIKDF